MNLATPELLGAALVILTVGLLAAFTVLGRKSTPAFRNIPGFSRLRKAVSLAVENGTRIHFSIGRASPVSTSVASAFVGLSAMRQVGERTAVSDEPPVVTSGDGALALLGQDTLRAAFRAAGAEDQFKASSGRVSGLTPFSYAAGALPSLRDEKASVHYLAGNFGVEVAFMVDAAEGNDVYVLSGSDDLTAQAVLFATVPETLIGEEVFAAGAYMNAGPMHGASLRVQDILRWLLIAVILIGAALRLVGAL